MKKADVPGMRRKSAINFADAQLLARQNRRNSAASRAYYALYQAMTAEFVDKGRKPSDFGPIDERYPEKWPHHVIVKHGAVIGLSNTEIELVAFAEGQRVKADYRPDPVEQHDVQDILDEGPDLLEGLGVQPEGKS